jgi:energy-coupling factor transporter transmembrane protein EcfT
VIRFLAPFPLVRVLIPFVCGIVIALSVLCSLSFVIVALLFSLIIVVVAHLSLKRSSHYYIYQGISLSILFAFCGMTAVKVQQYNYDQELASVREKVPVAVKS